MLDDNSKQICEQSVDVFNQIFDILKQQHPYEYAYNTATELTKIVFIAVAGV